MIFLKEEKCGKITFKKRKIKKKKLLQLIENLPMKRY